MVSVWSQGVNSSLLPNAAAGFVKESFTPEEARGLDCLGGSVLLSNFGDFKAELMGVSP